MSRQRSQQRKRSTKIVEEIPKVVKEKFSPQYNEEYSAHTVNDVKIVPANDNQRVALSMFREKKSIIFLHGAAGSGKSLLAAYHAATELKSKRIDKIYFIRPAVAVGKSIGLLPGEISDKLLPYFTQIIEHLGKFLGRGYLKYCLEKKIIEMKPSEFLRGMSLENCVCIAEECQNYTKDEFEMVLTRLGEGASIIFSGDEKQHDLRGVSGLQQTIALLERVMQEQPHYMLDEDLDAMDSNIGIVQFTPEDVVRSGLTRAFVKMYHHN